MKIRAKINIALILCFGFITLIGLLVGSALNDLANDTVKILNKNKDVMRYTQQMSGSLGNMTRRILASDEADSLEELHAGVLIDINKFDIQLEQYMNISTNPEEQSLKEELRNQFEKFKRDIELDDFDYYKEDITEQTLVLEKIIQRIYDINSKMVNKEVNSAYQTSERVTKMLMIISFFFFVFVLAAIIYFPSYLADPIRKIESYLKRVSRKDYSVRLQLNRKDEFGMLAQSFNNMVSQLEKYENVNVQNILIEKKRIENLVNLVNEAVIGVDNNKTVLFANKAFLDLVQMPASAVIGRNAEMLVNTFEIFEELLSELVYGDTVDSKKVSTLNSQNSEKTLYYEKEFLKINLDDEQGQRSADSSYVVIVKNVTEFKEKDLAKTNYMATLSHELKTPISAIDMSLDLLKDHRIGDLNEEQQDLTLTIRNNTQRLLDMINDVLDISKIETGNIQMMREWISPRVVVENALEATKTFIENKSIQLTTYTESDLPDLYIDVQKTSGVLINFITNAVRYTPVKGKIQIQLRQRVPNCLEYSVSDNGKGISEEDQKLIFHRFKRAKNDGTKGTGLGLAISQEFIEKQGGTIAFRSKLGKGSTFLFTLPIQKGE